MIDSYYKERLCRWGQTLETRVPDVDAAASFIRRVGIATLFPASPEVPNLFHAFVADPDAPTDSRHDSPSGQVYGWRWELGWMGAGFYSVIVRKRPTYVSWDLLPAVIRLRGELRSPDELFDAGVLSEPAYRIVQALEEAGGALATRELRRVAGFPTGKEQRATYLKAVEDLDSGLLLAKVFSPGSYEMSHALVAQRYPEAADAAARMTREVAIDRLLQTYLPQAVYVVPPVLAKHLGIGEPEVQNGLARLMEAGKIRKASPEEAESALYVWGDATLTPDPSPTRGRGVSFEETRRL